VSKSNGTKIVVGIFGIATGIFGGILLARKLKKESREEFIVKIRDIYGIYNEEFRDKYNKIKDSVEKKIFAIKNSGEMIDKDKYEKIVEDVVAGFKNDLEATKDGGIKIMNYLKKDWEKIKKVIA